MKPIFLASIICLVGLLGGGCEKDLLVYDGGSGIYFDNNEMLHDTISVSWGMKPGDVRKQILPLNVELYGAVKPYDRKFSIEVIADSQDTLKAEEGVDYESFPTEYVMKAGEARTVINVPLLRRENLAEKPRRFVVKLIENDELQFLYGRLTAVDSVNYRELDYQRVIIMDEDFPRPTWWTRYGESRFGEFSQKKASLICDVMAIDREEWMEMKGRVTAGYLSYVGKYMHQYLQEQEPPILDENGEPMEMGPDSQR